MVAMSIGIVGAGIGGLAAAIAFRKQGLNVTLFEQTRQFGRAGADINLTPNAVRALDGLGIGPALRRQGARPTYRISRTWDTGEETSRLPMSQAAEAAYGAPQLTLHRADLLQALQDEVPPAAIAFGHRVASVEASAAGADVVLVDGGRYGFDLVVGADGIHSAARTALFGAEQPRFTGIVAYRALVPGHRVITPEAQAFTKWWGPTPDSQIVSFPIGPAGDVFIFATIAQADWREESWTLPGSVVELRAAYAGYHPDARALLDACDGVLKTALYERDPLPHWSAGAVTLLGDSCHPMMPFMAQGAGSAIEDAVVLARCIGSGTHSDLAASLARYEAARRPRTSQLQLGSRSNAWLRDGGNADWVYGYDSWTTRLDEAA